MKKWSVGLFSCLTAVVFVFLIMAEGNPGLLFHDLDCPAGASAGRKDCQIEENAEQTAPSETGSQAGPASEAETAAGSQPVTGAHAAEDAGTVPVAESGFQSENGVSQKSEEARETFTSEGGYGTLSLSEHTASSSEGSSETGKDSGAGNAYSLSDYQSNEILVCYKNGDIRLVRCELPGELEEQIALLEADSSVDFCQPNFEYSSDVIQTSYLDMSQLPVYYGAEDEEDRMDRQIGGHASINIAKEHTTSPGDPFYYLQWALENKGDFTGINDRVVPKAGVDIGAKEAWTSYKAKKSAVIALVDTGVDYENTEISEHLWINRNEIAGNGLDDDGNGYIDDVHGWNFYGNNNQIYAGSEDDHGTHCASSMVSISNTSGIAGIADYSNISVMSVKALGGSNGGGTTLTVMKAIVYAEQNGASICNLSLGTSVNDRLLYRTMKASGMLFVVAAGNSPSPSENGRDIDSQPCYPASYDLDNILTVANVDAGGNIHHTSNYGRVSVDLAAPGSDILAFTADRRLAFMTGTSMAAPIVSASAAMVYTASEDRTLADTALILKKTAKRDPVLWESVSTGGIPDLGKAVSWK